LGGDEEEDEEEEEEEEGRLAGWQAAANERSRIAITV